MVNNWSIAEYTALRQEIITRIKFLHQILAASVLMQVALLMFGYILYLREVELTLYLLLVPILCNFLTFNYQSNQMSLEAISKYIHESLSPRVQKAVKKESVLEWDKYFSVHKGHYKFEAFFKVMPLIFPNLMPFVPLFVSRPLTGWEITLLTFDFLLLVIMVENFRYKLRRVK